MYGIVLSLIVSSYYYIYLTISSTMCPSYLHMIINKYTCMHACHHLISSTRGVLEYLIDIFQQPLIVVRVEYILNTDDADAVIHRSSSSNYYSYPSTHGVASTLDIAIIILPAAYHPQTQVRSCSHDMI